MAGGDNCLPLAIMGLRRCTLRSYTTEFPHRNLEPSWNAFSVFSEFPHLPTSGKCRPPHPTARECRTAEFAGSSPRESCTICHLEEEAGMSRFAMVARIAVCAVLACVCALSQEPYEDRAARLQPNDIPPLIEKAQAGDRPSQVLLWLAYSGGHGVPKDAKKGVPYLRMAAE